jgi:HK97 family phage portal protein
MSRHPARGLAASLDNPEVFPDATNLAKVYQLTTLTGGFEVEGSAELPVSRDLALSVPAVHRGVSLLSTTVAGLPLSRVDAQGRRVDLGWLDQPEPGRSRYATFSDLATDLLLDGVGYLWVRDRHSTGAPKRGACEYVAIPRISVTHVDGTVQVRVDGRPVDRSDIIAFPGWHKGIRVHGARIIRTAIALEAAARRYADTPMPAQILVNNSGYELTDTEIDDLIAAYKKSRNSEAVGYVNAGVTAQSVGFDAAQLQLVEARAFTNSQLANLLGVPSHLIAGASSMSGSNLTYQNVTQENRAFVDYGLKPLIRAIESRLSMSDAAGIAWDNQVTPRGTQVRFDLDALLRGNPLERAQLYQILIPLGVLTVDEARDMEDLAPQGDVQS